MELLNSVSVLACACPFARMQARHLRGDTISRRGRVGHGRVNYGGVLSSLPRILANDLLTSREVMPACRGVKAFRR